MFACIWNEVDSVFMILKLNHGLKREPLQTASIMSLKLLYNTLCTELHQV